MNWDKFSDKLTESKKKVKLDPVGKEDSDVNNDNVVDDSDSYLKKRRETIGKKISDDRLKKESLDPVGKEDDDIDNDGDKDKSDKYLLNRRRVRNKIISQKVSEECGCEDEKKVDYREMKTKINLAKNKLRSMGLKMSYELEGEQIDEIAPLAIGAGVAAAAAAPYLLKKFAKPAVDKAIDKPATGSGGLIDKMKQRRDAINKLNQSYEPDGSLVEGRKKKDDSYLETDMEKRRSNNEKAIEDMKDTKAHKDMVKAARKSMGIDEESEVCEICGCDPCECELIDEGMSLKDFKANRRKLKRKEASDDAKKRGHVGKEWYNSGRTYSSDEAKSGRAKMDDAERQTRHRSAVDPDNDNDDMYSADKTKNPKKLRKQKAMGEITKEEFISEDEYRKLLAKERRDEKEKESRRGGRKSITPGKQSVGIGRDYADSNISFHRKVTGKTTTTEEVENIEEKALSRAQQRFMGMVYAAKKGETPASPEVAKAASGMSKKAAKDFAKTKHEGLPEKKEDAKEELNLVQRMISNYSPLEEGKLDDLLKSIRDDDDDAKSESDSNEDQKKRVLKKKGQEEKKSTRRGKGATSSRERQVVASGATRVKSKSIEAKGKKDVAKIEAESKLKAEQEKTKREEMKGSRQEKKREYQQQDKAEKAVERAKKEAESRKQEEIKNKISKADREVAAKKKTREEIGGAVKGAIKGMKTRTFSSEGGKDGEAAAAVAGNIGQVGVAAGKAVKGTAKALWKARSERKEREAKEKRDEKIRREAESKTESFSNWRESFLVEVDDQVVNSDSPSKIIDVMPKKKKNNIEISPKLDEAAPLVGILARALGGTVARGVGSRLAGGAASGTLRKKASEFVGNKAGELTAQKVDDLMQKKKKKEEDGETMLGKLASVGESAAWTKKAGKSESGGLNEKGRRSYERENPGSDLKAPSKKVGNPRRASFCSRMSGMKAKLTSKKTANDPDSRINKSLRAWNC
jgi:hypothetical protein